MTHLSLFLLMSTLIMLVPFTSINFSTVKAQEYGASSYDYDVDDRYNQYPTEENKYECQTDPFEGFFVSSVEFCKHIKFDNRKDNDRTRDNNVTGIQGPPGPAGPQGPPGPQGPAGPSRIDATSLYPVFGPISVTGPTAFNVASSTALCLAGDTVFAGGEIVIPAGTGNSTVNGIQSVALSSNTGWLVAGTGPFLQVQAYALCFNNP